MRAYGYPQTDVFVLCFAINERWIIYLSYNFFYSFQLGNNHLQKYHQNISQN
jgi:hypothetical protein